MKIYDEFGLTMAGAILAALLAVTVLAGFAAIGQYAANVSKCSHIHSLTGFDTNVSFSMGCLVKYNGEWMDVDTAMTNTVKIK